MNQPVILNNPAPGLLFTTNYGIKGSRVDKPV